MNVGGEHKTFPRERLMLLVVLLMCVLAMFTLTYGLDFESPAGWEIRCAAAVFFSGVTVFALYGLHHVIKAVATWYAVIAFVSLVLIFFVALQVANDFVAASISDLGTVHLLLKLPIAAIGLFAGVGSLLLTRTFWIRGRTMINLLVAGYFFITGTALIVGYFLIDVLTGLVRLI